MTAGDPGMKVTEQLVLELERAGADIIELGVPFSDPLADGPTIQAACQRALECGVDIPAILALVRRIRKKSEIPLALMSYANPIHAYGAAAFSAACRKAGVDGVIVPDLPPEEGKWLAVPASREGVDVISFAAPTSTAARLRRVAKASRGFIYYVSLTGITGARARLPRELRSGISSLKAVTGRPVAVGFGISSPSQAREVARLADGVIVGSAIVSIAAGGGRDRVRRVGRFATRLARAVHGAR